VWELIGEEASYFKDQREAVIKKPRFYYYDKEGEIAETTGETAHLFFNERDLDKMQLAGGIQISYQGYMLKTNEAIYLPAEERIVLPTRAMLAGNGIELEGSSMEVDLDSKKLRLMQNVKSKVEPDKLARRNKNANDGMRGG
jgi:LPS export ABC transporter protein LptC